MKFILPVLICILFGIGLVLISISIFHPILIWDESRLIVNAIEMSQNKNYFVTYYEGSPDLWNTKPPLFIWILVLLIKMFGYSEWVYRILPISCFFTILYLVYQFCVKEFNDRIAGILAVLSLFFSIGFNGHHSSMTADYDILLSLFSILSFIHYYKFLNKNSSKHLIFSFLFLTLAVLTKGIAGLFMIPGFLLYTIYTKKLRVLLFTPYLYVSILVFFSIVGGYYFIRESSSKGYLEAVFLNELGGRFNSTIEEHNHPFYYFIVKFFEKRYFVWFAGLIICSILFRYKKVRDSSINNFFIFSWFCISTFLIVISSAGTKLSWYDVPIYPVMSLLFGLTFSNIYKWSFNNYKILSLESFVLVIIIASASFHIVKTYKYLTLNDELERPGKHIKYTTEFYPELKSYVYLSNGYNSQLLCYKYISKLRDNIDITISDTNRTNLSGLYVSFSDSNIRSKLILDYGTTFKLKIKSSFGESIFLGSIKK